MSNHAFTLLASESWKSASSQNVSQTVSNGVIWSEKVKSGFNSWHQNPGSLREVRTSRRPVLWAMAPAVLKMETRKQYNAFLTHTNGLARKEYAKNIRLF